LRTKPNPALDLHRDRYRRTTTSDLLDKNDGGRFRRKSRERRMGMAL
jgi:hypothetical protein